MNLIERMTALTLKRKLFMLLFVMFLTIVAAVGASKIKVDDGARDIFASSYPEYARFSQHRTEFPQADTEIVVVARSEEPFDQAQLEGLRDLVFDGQLIDGVEFAHSVFSVQERAPLPADQIAPDSDLDPQAVHFQTVIKDDLSSYSSASEALNQAESSDWKILSMVNEQHTQALIIFSVSDDRVENKTVQPILDEFNALIRDTSSQHNLKIEITGTLPILNLIVNQIIEEQALLNGVGAILGALVSLIMFRSLVVGILNGAAPIIAVLLTLGAMGWLGLEMNVITNSISILVLVMTMANCIHMTFELRKHAGRGTGRDESIRSMMAGIAPACTLTGLTTIIAMAGLYYSDSVLIKGFSIAAVIGLLMSIFATLFVHPLVFAITWRFSAVQRALTRPFQPQENLARSFNTATLWLLRRKTSVAAISLVLTALLLNGFLPVQTTHRFNEYLYDDAPIVQSLKRAEAISSPTQSLDIVLLQSESDTPLLSQANLDALEQVHEGLEAAFPNTHINSLHVLREILRNSDEPYGSQGIADLLDELPERMRSELIGFNEDGFKISLRIEDQPSSQVRMIITDIEAILAKSDLDKSGLRAEPITGLTAMAAILSDQMIKELTISFLIAAFACPLLIGLWYREWRYGLAAVLPNVIPVLAVGAFLMYSGINLQFIGAIALSIAFGIAVDDTVHVLNRLDITRREKAGALTLERLAGVMQYVAPALITTTVVLSVGISAVFISQMPTVLFFGAMCVAIFILALLTDLFMLLPVLAVLERRKIVD